MSVDRTVAREDFIRALYWLLDERKVPQRQLAEDLGWYSHTKINPWRNLKSEPEAWEVFALEEYLRVPPGTLSSHLGYVPKGVRTAEAASVEDAIASDTLLPEWGREALINLRQAIAKNAKPGGKR